MRHATAGVATGSFGDPAVVAVAFFAVDRLQAWGQSTRWGCVQNVLSRSRWYLPPCKAAFGTAESSLFPAEQLNASRYNRGFDRTAATLLRPVDASAFGSREPFERRFSGLSFAGDPRRDRCAMLACRFIWSYK